jgi:hypothetical protein
VTNEKYKPDTHSDIHLSNPADYLFHPTIKSKA